MHVGPSRHVLFMNRPRPRAGPVLLPAADLDDPIAIGSDISWKADTPVPSTSCRRTAMSCMLVIISLGWIASFPHHQAPEASCHGSVRRDNSGLTARRRHPIAFGGHDDACRWDGPSNARRHMRIGYLGGHRQHGATMAGKLLTTAAMKSGCRRSRRGDETLLSGTRHIESLRRTGRRMHTIVVSLPTLGGLREVGRRSRSRARPSRHREHLIRSVALSSRKSRPPVPRKVSPHPDAPISGGRRRERRTLTTMVSAIGDQSSVATDLPVWDRRSSMQATDRVRSDHEARQQHALRGGAGRDLGGDDICEQSGISPSESIFQVLKQQHRPQLRHDGPVPFKVVVPRTSSSAPPSKS